MMHLPKDIFNFFKWWAIKAPSKILIIFKRILILVNNEASFFLNLKMLFVPLFGDYTWVGRLMGIIYRLTKIVIGLIVLVFIFALSIIITLTWFLLPAIALYYLDAMAFVLFIFVAALWVVSTKNTPPLRVSDVPEDKIIKAFRPKAALYLHQFQKENSAILSSFIAYPDIHKMLIRLEIDLEKFKKELTRDFVFAYERVLHSALKLAEKQGTRYVETEHLLYALIENLENPERFVAKFDLEVIDFERTSYWIVNHREVLASVFFWQEDYKVSIMGGVNRGKTGRVTPALTSVSVDLTEQAQKGLLKKITAHKQKTEEVIQILSGFGNANVLIVGPPGSGKSSIVKGIAQKIIKGTAEDALKFKRIVSIDSGSLISGAKTPGEISSRVKKIMEDAEGSANIILFFDEIHNLILGSANGNSSIFSLLEPYFSSGKFQIVGATNLENYRKYIEPNGAFSRLFSLVEISETNEEETIEVLENVAYSLEKQYGVTISFPAIRDTYKLSKKLIHERVFPDKGIDVLSRTAGRKSRVDKIVTKNDVAVTVSNITHVPVAAISQDESEKLLNIEKTMKTQVIGQDHAIDQIGKAMKRGRVGMRSESKPIASFLFVGTTGVGKTETAKALARNYFGSEKAMIRLDMSEYQQKDSLSRLIGSPDGSSKGVLTEAVRKSPFAILLLDEIEKANSQVLLTFLQVLDDGRLTDSSGTLVDFTNTIIIATSNVGTRAIQEVTKRDGKFEEVSKVALKAVGDHYAPEFLNRFSGIIVFKPLSKESIRKITHLMLIKVQKNADEKGIEVHFKPELVNKLMEKGFNSEWGARPMARVIEDSVETYLALKILSNEVHPGDTLELGIEVFD